MARSNSSSSTWKYFAGSVAVVGVAFCIGYFVIGGPRHEATPPENVVPSNVAAPPPPVAAKPTVIALKPRTQNGEYTAPGAPRISISEERNPSLLDTSKQQPKPDDGAAKPADPEASQEAAPTPKTVATDSTPTDATPLAGDPTPPAADSSTPSPADGTTPTPPPTPGSTDPDTEQVGNHAGEIGQEGATSKAQFRVQAGSFVASENAKALADALRRRGYTTSTHAERDGDKTVFKVQVGAYRTKSAADKAAQDLQDSGYPASVSPLNP